MYTIHIQKGGNNTSPCTTGFSIEKDENIHFVGVCHTENDTLSSTVHRICTDAIVEIHITEKDAVHIFTELLEKINHELDKLYTQHKKTDISLFLGVVVKKHIHFSVFGKELTGIIVSNTNIEDILSDMDTGEGHFVYDSHGDLRDNETLYIFAPKIDTHVIGGECKNLSHLPISERSQLIIERIERSYTPDAFLLSIGKDIAVAEKINGILRKCQKQERKGKQYYEVLSKY